MKKSRLLIVVAALGFLICCSIACVGLVSLSTLGSIDSNPFEIGDAVAVIYVEGPIVMGAPASDFGGGGSAYSETIVEYLRKAQGDSSIKAIVLRVESPGGSVVASREIYDEVMTTRSKGKPVVASFGEIAASGGYYISAGADKIYAHAGTLTGSIGVISVIPNIEGLTDKLGVKMFVVKSGAHKDESYGFRDLSPEERDIWQKLIDESYEDFASIVASGRKLDINKVKSLADGRIFTGKQAKEVGLADEIGNLDAAILGAAKLGGITGKPRTIKYRRESSLFSAFASSVSPAWGSNEIIDLFALKQWGRVMYLYMAP